MYNIRRLSTAVKTINNKLKQCYYVFSIIEALKNIVFQGFVLF